jgi:hypothetical protein
MNNNYVRVTLFVLLPFMALIFCQVGCSGRANGTAGTPDDTSGSNGLSGTGNNFEPSGVQEKSIRVNQIVELVSKAGTFYYFFPQESPSYTIPKLIDTGFVAIKPLNPFTGNPMVFSEEYIPGEICVFVGDRTKAEGYFIRHYDPSEPEYDPILVEKGEWIHKEGMAENEYFNGRTFKRVPPGPSEPPADYLTTRDNWGIINHTDDQIKVESLASQMLSIIGKYSLYYEEVPGDFEVYIDWLGDKNPTAWVNPYTGEPVKQVPMVACATSPEDPDAPLDEIPEDISSFIGNYAYEVYDNGTYIVSLTRFYYLDEDGVFKSEDIVGFPCEAWLNTVKNLGH